MRPVPGIRGGGRDHPAVCVLLRTIGKESGKGRQPENGADRDFTDDMIWAGIPGSVIAALPGSFMCAVPALSIIIDI